MSSSRTTTHLDPLLTLLADLLLELVERDEVVLDDDRHLELLDAVPDGDELGQTPHEAGLLDRADKRLERGHVGLVVPGLDVERHERLGNRLGLVGLLGGVLGEALLLERLGLGVDLLVRRAEQVEVVVVGGSRGSGGGGGGRGRGAVGGVGLGGVAGERLVLSLVRLDVLVPAGRVRVGGRVRGRRERLEDGNVGLRGGVAVGRGRRGQGSRVSAMLVWCGCERVQQSSIPPPSIATALPRVWVRRLGKGKVSSAFGGRS